jgi:hypothetical protein
MDSQVTTVEHQAALEAELREMLEFYNAAVVRAQSN